MGFFEVGHLEDNGVRAVVMTFIGRSEFKPIDGLVRVIVEVDWGIQACPKDCFAIV